MNMTLGRVLVVDDEVSLRLTLAANLELEGFSVVEAESAEQALERLETREFDLVVSGIRMPGMHGVDLFRRIRERWPSLPVVLMSAFAVEQLVDEAVQEGVYTVLSKPFDVAGVLELLKRAAQKPVVLVVDDESDNAETTAEALRATGLRARAVGEARSAIAMVTGGTVDVAVVDLVMPDRSGVDLIDDLLSIDPGLTIIAVSGHSVPALMRKVASRGAYACMVKPVPPRDLVATIARARGARGR
jgi:DNA-binding NtrC family response regulator